MSYYCEKKKLLCKNLSNQDYKFLIYMFYHSKKEKKEKQETPIMLLKLFGFTFNHMLKNNVCNISSILSN